LYFISGFLLPAESGEKVSLEVTVLLSQSVFLLVISDFLPPSADNFPILGMEAINKNVVKYRDVMFLFKKVTILDFIKADQTLSEYDVKFASFRAF
jgi:hypothetical protein